MNPGKFYEGMHVRDKTWGHVGKVVSIRTPRGRRRRTEIVVDWQNGGMAVFVDTDDPSYNRISELVEVRFRGRRWEEVQYAEGAPYPRITGW